MWQHQENILIDETTPELIWKAWSDVSLWPNWWKRHLISARCLSQFNDNSKLEMKTRYLITSKAVLADIKSGKSFSTISKLPGAVLKMFHEVKSIDNKTSITYVLTIEGPLTFFYKAIVGAKIKSELPTVIKTLAAYSTNQVSSENA